MLRALLSSLNGQCIFEGTESCDLVGDVDQPAKAVHWQGVITAEDLNFPRYSNLWIYPHPLPVRLLAREVQSCIQAFQLWYREASRSLM